MEKSKIFIASSSRTQLLAEKLRDELATDYCEARLWKDESNGKPSETIIEMLEGVAAKYDFAIIVLARDDVIINEAGDALKARDNCVFEAGLFMAALGRKRCFLVNSVEQRELPSDLAGIILLPFTEPTNLRDRGECARAIAEVAGKIKDAVQFAGRTRGRPLSADELLDREKLQNKDPGGELFEDQVVVASIQPVELGYDAALQVKKNIDDGVRYVYFFHGNMDGARKICMLLQMMLLAAMLDREKASDFAIRESTLKEEATQTRIVTDLTKICDRESLKMFFLPAAPNLQYCIHNATDVYKAVLYFKHGDKFIEWETGSRAYQFWEEVRQKQGIDSDPPRAIFHGASGFRVKEDPFYRTLKQEVLRYFPGIQEKVTKLCFDGALQ
jgi:hypothetical protein